MSPEYEHISANTDQYLADSENQTNIDNQLLLGDRDMQSLHSNEIDMPTTVAQSSDDLKCIDNNGRLFSRQSYSPLQRSSNKYGVQLSNYEVETTQDTSSRSKQDYLDLDDKKNEAKLELEEYPDNPKWAVFFFVMYTVCSAYNLVSGKYFRIWHPQMSTFELLFYRGFSAVLLMLIYMGRDTKNQLFNKVNSENFPPLSFRIF